MKGSTQQDNPATGFRWPVAVTHEFSAPASRIWDTISMPGNLEWCHPFCRKNPVLAWPGPEARDEVHYLNGLVYERRFHQWIEGTGYDLKIGAPGAPESLVSWRISPGGENSSRLSITVCPYILQGIPLPIRWVPHVLKVRPMLKQYLDSVVRGFEWYLAKGEAVPRNQWGEHPWFSRRRKKKFS